MTEIERPEIPTELQPSAHDVAFDLGAALDSVVSLRSEVPEGGFTARTLGTERAGHAVVINERGLVVTIGYLVVEASQVWLMDNHGGGVEGHVMGYDQETGFGLVQPLGHLNAKPLEVGSSADVGVGTSVILAGHGGPASAVKTEVIDKREFAGYWEYLLDEAIFTSPPHPLWGGGALIDADGRLVGIGSLFVQEADESGSQQHGNMIVPIDILAPIMDELTTYGRRQRPPRPWLGVFSAESSGRVVVAGLWDGGPADQAGLQAGDLVIGIAGRPVADLGSFYRQYWSLGDAGVDVPLNVYRDGDVMEIVVASAAREDFMTKVGTVH